MKKIFLFSLIISGLFAQNCVMCHNWAYQKKLNQFTPEQIKQMMMDFKSGKKAGATMPSIAKNMSDKEIEEVSKEFGKKEIEEK